MISLQEASLEFLGWLSLAGIFMILIVTHFQSIGKKDR